VLETLAEQLGVEVSDEEIAERLRTMESCEHACTALLDLALERGGSDNITIIAGRARVDTPG